MLKNECKIRKWLGNDYHLVTDSNDGWRLFKKYDDWEKYMSPDNKSIMTSETNTEEELYEFAKKNKKNKEIDERKAIFITTQIILWSVVVLMFINIKVKSEIIIGFAFGIDFLVIVLSLVRLKVSDYNLKMSLKNMNRKFGYREDFNPFNRWQIKSVVGYGNEEYIVSTTDLGLNHSFINECEPLYYEIVISRLNSEETNRFEYFQERYSTKEEARKRHKEIVKLFKDGKASDLIE